MKRVHEKTAAPEQLYYARAELAVSPIVLQKLAAGHFVRNSTADGMQPHQPVCQPKEPDAGAGHLLAAQRAQHESDIAKPAG